MDLCELTFRIQRNDTIAPEMLDALEHHTASLSQNICDIFQTLNAIMLRHEALTIDRWTRKTDVQRKKILLAAWPGMAKEHRPDREEFSRRWVSAKDGTVAEYVVYPFSKSAMESRVHNPLTILAVNQEDLITPNALLIFLHARGRMAPWEFAAIELEFSPKLSLFFGGCNDTA